MNLIKKLNNLKCIKADSQWKEKNRSILFNQILNSTVQSVDIQVASQVLQTRGVWNPAVVVVIKFLKELSYNFAQLMRQPTMAVFFIALIALSTGAVSAHFASKSAKPNDSLYVAKMISEKAQLAVTFNQEKKDKKTTQFANDHAKDITEVLADSNFNNEANKVEVEKLVQNFKQEISIVRSGLKKMGLNKTSKKSGVGGMSEIGRINGVGEKKKDNIASSSNEETQVFSANLGKDEKGIQISETKIETNEIKKNEEQATSTQVATNTKVEILVEDSSLKLKNAESAIEAAKQLFDEKNYNKTLEKLEQVDNAIQTVSQVSTQNVGTSTIDKTL